jgi:hypothetical protein
MIINAIYDDIHSSRQSFILLLQKRRRRKKGGICGRYTLNINALRLEVRATNSSFLWVFIYIYLLGYGSSSSRRRRRSFSSSKICALRLENNRPGLFREQEPREPDDGKPQHATTVFLNFFDSLSYNPHRYGLSTTTLEIW